MRRVFTVTNTTVGMCTGVGLAVTLLIEHQHAPLARLHGTWPTCSDDGQVVELRRVLPYQTPNAYRALERTICTHNQYCMRLTCCSRSRTQGARHNPIFNKTNR